ncbi:BLUF domain-containing protein [Methylobacterium sp. E-065]|uniref:BLUF domain-containing protein n=1 Tax=Methylobacterium sp. E-065 TaxID=2836583 RepID=UPI001FBB59B7|nr:BLUF domain-containing protein [Methylobacterium sp. E-065]MCJ2020601.1 BLUF domain-containing protein [Methylobacterium sp. E-065]
MSELYRLVYASKNLFQGTDAELTATVSQILAASQRNNDRSDVTGALMFNAGAFAQVLEGPRRGVEETFERIQCDDRHGDVTVLQCGPTEARSFANWSMAFVGQSAQGQAKFNQIASESGFDLSRMDGDAVFAMLHELVLEEEGLPTSLAIAPSIKPTNARPPVGLDVEQLRAEITQLRPDAAAMPMTTPADDKQRGEIVEAERRSSLASDVKCSSQGATAAALSILKAALADERQRTNDLRTEIDALQIALASSEDQLDAMRIERDRWAVRAGLLATAMAQEASDVQNLNFRAESAEAHPNTQLGLEGAARVLAA